MIIKSMYLRDFMLRWKLVSKWTKKIIIFSVMNSVIFMLNTKKLKYLLYWRQMFKIYLLMKNQLVITKCKQEVNNYVAKAWRRFNENFTSSKKWNGKLKHLMGKNQFKKLVHGSLYATTPPVYSNPLQLFEKFAAHAKMRIGCNEGLCERKKK